MLVFEERGKPEYPEKTSRSRVENQQTQLLLLLIKIQKYQAINAKGWFGLLTEKILHDGSIKCL